MMKSLVRAVFVFCLTTLLLGCDEQMTWVGASNVPPSVASDAPPLASLVGDPTPTPQPSPSSTPDPISEIQDACEDPSVTKISRTEVLTFPENALTCHFGDAAGGNLPGLNAFVQARHETRRSLSQIPSDATLCGIQFVFSSPQMYFDDGLMLNFNDAILISSDNWKEKNILASDGPLMIYDWMRMAGQSDRAPGKFRNLYGDCAGQASDCSTYCVGSNANPLLNSSCKMPPETPTDGANLAGLMYLQINDPLIYYSLAKRAKDQSRFDFDLISFGDNDTGDCKHGALSVTVSYSYIP